MMILGITYDKGMKITKRDFNKLVELAYLKVGILWQKEMLPTHFLPGASKKYDYQPRGGENLPRNSKSWRKSYVARRERVTRKRSDRPANLVFSGRSRTLSRKGRVIATGKRLRVTIPAPTLNLRAHMRREVTATTKDEEKRLEDLFQEVWEKEFKAFQKQRALKNSKGLR